MRHLLVAGIVIGGLILGGCSGASVRSSGHIPESLMNSSVAFAGDDALSEALSGEFLSCGFTVVERSRLMSVLEEHHLSFSGILEKENADKIGKILNVDALVYASIVPAAAFGDRLASATVKIVDIKTGQIVLASNYSNGGGGAAGSPADAQMKQKLPASARLIAREIAEKFQKKCSF